MPSLESLEALLQKDGDNAALRFAAGNHCYREKNYERAIVHLRHAVRVDSGYSAAWKLYGRALADSGLNDEAADAFRHGIDAAERKKDKQAVREMKVFLRRLEK